ncbi:hypothetical protein ACEPPN_007609 [Leptodophora sp. 'Broadleaf-Isolate-01']
MATSSQENTSKKDLSENDTVDADNRTGHAARSFDGITQKIETNSPDKKKQQNLSTVKGRAEKKKVGRPRGGKFHEEIPVEETSAMSKGKGKPEFPAEKYNKELVNIQAQLDLVTSTKLIETYNILGRHDAMHEKLKSLKGRTSSLLTELKNRKKIYAVANRLICGDGLDSNLGRLDRDVMWFVAELRYRQMDSKGSTTLID